MPDLPYDPNTLLGQARLHAADTCINPITGGYVFSDAEMTYFLTAGGSIPELAAAKALRSAAADNAKVAIITKIGQMGDDESKVFQALLATAEGLEARAIQPPAVSAVREHSWFGWGGPDEFDRWRW